MSGLYKIKTVAERSGFSATLLRAWERRYGFLEPERQPSGHRFYTDKDLRVLRSVKLLLDRGQSVGEVAALGRDELLRMSIPPGNQDGLGQARKVDGGEALQGDLLEKKQKLLTLVSELDANKARSVVQAVFDSGLTWEQTLAFINEVCREVGRLWAEGKLSVSSEHLLTSLWKERLHSLIGQMDTKDSDGKVIVCAGFPDELHELGLLILHYEWLRAGHEVLYLGPALPFEDLDGVLTRVKPHLVCLTVTRTPVLQMHLPAFGDLVRRHPGSRFLVGGYGVQGQEDKLVQQGATPWLHGGSLSDIEKECFGE